MLSSATYNIYRFRRSILLNSLDDLTNCFALLFPRSFLYADFAGSKARETKQLCSHDFRHGNDGERLAKF